MPSKTKSGKIIINPPEDLTDDFALKGREKGGSFSKNQKHTTKLFPPFPPKHEVAILCMGIAMTSTLK